MFCGGCGKELQEGTQFCPYCGASSAPAGAVSPAVQPQGNRPGNQSYRNAGTGMAQRQGVARAGVVSVGQQGTSNVPLIMGIIGAILMLPGLLCAVMCGGIAGGAGASSINSVRSGVDSGMIWGLIVGIVPIVGGIFGGIKGKSAPMISFICLLASAVFAGIGWYLTLFMSFFHLGALILFVVGAIMAKVQKME